MVTKNLAAYEPPKQTRSVFLHWRQPEEWAEVLHKWVQFQLLYHFPVANQTFLKVSATGQLNTILTFLDITEPPIESPLTNLPIPLLKKAIAILAKTNRAQLFGIADGEGVRFFASK